MQWLSADMFLQDDNRNLIAVVRVKEFPDGNIHPELKVTGRTWVKLQVDDYEDTKEIRRAAMAYLEEMGLIPTPDECKIKADTPPVVPRAIAKELRQLRDIEKSHRKRGGIDPVLQGTINARRKELEALIEKENKSQQPAGTESIDPDLFLQLSKKADLLMKHGVHSRTKQQIMADLLKSHELRKMPDDFARQMLKRAGYHS